MGFCAVHLPMVPLISLALSTLARLLHQVAHYRMGFPSASD